jgi:hypothetical protein
MYCQAVTFMMLLAVTKPAEGSPAEDPLGVRALAAPSAVSERLCAEVKVSCQPSLEQSYFMQLLSYIVSTARIHVLLYKAESRA